MGKESGYKMKCLMSSDCQHFDDTLRLIPQREYGVRRAMYLKDSSHYFQFYCDNCLCLQGDFCWMFRCQKERQRKYNGHDICLNCVHDVIKKCKELKALLDELLIDELTNDCIQTIVVYTAGNVVKLSK